MKRIVSMVTGAATALAMCLGMAMPAQAQDSVITIGVASPLTGLNAVQGNDILNGIKLAVQRINNGYEVPMNDGSTVKLSPEILGGKIELDVEDTESRPASALSAVRKLVNADHVPVVLGSYSSGICVPTGAFTNKNNTVQISTGCTSPKLREIGPYFFNMIGLDALMGAATANLAFNDSGATKYASIVPNNPFGVGIEIQSCKRLEELGAECVTKVRYRQGKSEYRADLNRLMSQDPEAVLFTAYGTDSRLILKQAYELGIDVSKTWYSDYPTMWSNEISDVAQIGEGIKGVRAGEVSQFFETEYAQAYEQAYGKPPQTAFGSYAYDSAMLTALAIKKAGAATADGIRDALRPVSINYKGVSGNKKLDKDGMQVSDQYTTLIYKDGKLAPYKVK